MIRTPDRTIPPRLGVILCGKVVIDAMTNKQKRFCDEYLIDCNATQAAIRAGYSAKTAKQIGQENLTKLDIKNYIDARMTKIRNDSIADATEIIKYLTSVVRGESQGTEIVVEGIGDGRSEARTIKKAPSEKDRLKAAELLGKRYGIFRDNVAIELEPVTISNDLKE